MNFLMDYYEDLVMEHIKDETHYYHFDKIRIITENKRLKKENERLTLEFERLLHKRKLVHLKVTELESLGTKEQICNDPELLKRARTLVQEIKQIKEQQ